MIIHFLIIIQRFMKTKVIVNYLPQYHSIPENDKWWGVGFTDWNPVKNAKPLYVGHNQPKTPLNNHYYTLNDKNEIKWQIELANEYGIYGFAIYHYWFNSDMQLLEKPSEIIRDNKDLNTHYFFLWDNATWKRTWSNVKHANDWAPNYDIKDNENNSGILAELIYGTEPDWKKHYDYLATHFKDKRYIKISNRPVFGFFQPQNDINTLKKMVAYWNELAIQDGFDGIFCMSRDNHMGYDLENKFRYSPLVPNNIFSYLKYKVKDVIAKKTGRVRLYNYDREWHALLKDARDSDCKTFLSGFVQFDDTPRRGKNGRIIKGSSPEKFENYFRDLYNISLNQGKEFVLLTAWNEWGEGCYLEPDIENQYAYLEAIKRVIEDNK